MCNGHDFNFGFGALNTTGLAVEAFTLQCWVSTAAVTFESEPLDGCPSWDLKARTLQATTSTNAQVKIFLESSDATGRVVEDLVAAASSSSFSASF